MTEVTIHAAKTQLSKLVARAEAGEEVLIVRGREREPVAKLVPVRAKRGPTPGFLKGQIEVPDSFFDPLPDDELEAWGQV